MSHSRFFARILLALTALLCGCASYTASTQKGLDDFGRRDFADAEKVYTPGADKEGRDQLVYLFDRATVRYQEGKYQDSLNDFLLADKLSEIKDYVALGTEIASALTSETITTYKGEEFEHVLVSVYLALNLAALHRDDDAIVACRQVNQKLETLREESKRHYSLNAFAQYLAGVLFERDHNWNFAYVDYKKTEELAPAFSRLKLDLVKGALEMDSSSDLDKYRKLMLVTDSDVAQAERELKKTGGVVLLYQNGFAPEKVVSKTWKELPAYQVRYNRHRAARLYLNGAEVARSEVLYDVEKAAIQDLKDKYATYIVKRLAGMATQAVIANQLNKKEQGLGTIFQLAMDATSRPDLRSWLTLPKDFQVARAQVVPGKYHATLRLENTAGGLEGEKDLGEVEVKGVGDIAVLNYRSLND